MPKKRRVDAFPVVADLTKARSPSLDEVILTEPPRGVYFNAFASRFQRTAVPPTLGRVCHGGTTVAPQSKERLEPPLLSLYRKAR